MINFDDYRHKGLKFYRRVARVLENSEDLGYADRLITCIMQVLRERMTFTESLEFLSFLPLHVKGVFVNGWKINHHPKRLSSADEFLNAIRIKYPVTAGRKPGSDEQFKKDIEAVFSVIQHQFSSKGTSDVKKFIPEVLHNFLAHESEKDKPVVEMINDGGKHFPEVQPIKDNT